jgi:hypothetical protein
MGSSRSAFSVLIASAPPVVVGKLPLDAENAVLEVDGARRARARARFTPEDGRRRD